MPVLDHVVAEVRQQLGRALLKVGTVVKVLEYNEVKTQQLLIK
jgi:hypothetical protein